MHLPVPMHSHASLTRIPHTCPSHVSLTRVPHTYSSHVSHTCVPRSALVHTDPIIKWASTRWPTFVELCLYVIDHYVPKYGLDKSVMPLGGAVTRELFLNASALFAARGKNWLT